jgi:DNA-binding HxlR family transcriptional regulator
MEIELENAEDKATGCIAFALSVLGNKWSALILQELANGPRRHGEISAAIGCISPRSLSQRLEALIEQGIIAKEVFAEVPPRSEYQLTERGRDLLPILGEMSAWGDKYQCPPK